MGVPPAEQAGFDDDAVMLSTAGAVVFAALILVGLVWVLVSLRNRRRAYVTLRQDHKEQCAEAQQGVQLAQLDETGRSGDPEGAAVVAGDENKAVKPVISGGAALTQQLTVYCTSALGTVNRSTLSPVVSLASLSPMRPKEAME